MARCEGTTRNGDQCKREARADSRFCHVHDPEQTMDEGTGSGAEADELELRDLTPILLAGALVAGLVFLLRGFGKWIPRL